MAKQTSKPKSPRICVADDSSFTRQIISKALLELGYENVVEAEDGEEALSAITKNRPTLIIADWDMPRMSGVELLRAVRKYAPCSDVPFLLISSAPNRDILLTLAREEKAEFLAKPFSLPSFKDKVERMLIKLEIKEIDTSIPTLVVDDLSSARKIMNKMLSDLGFTNITVVENGIKALEVIQNGGAQLVISDWDMPEMSGLELLQWVRANPQWKNVIFVMVTSLAGKERVIEAMKAGVSAYLVKPFEGAALEEKLSALLPAKQIS